MPGSRYIYASAKILSLLIWSIEWIEQEVGNSFWYVLILLEKLAKSKSGVGQIPKALFSDDVLRIASQNIGYYFEKNIGCLVRYGIDPFFLGYKQSLS